MDEKRKFNRLSVEKGKKILIEFEGHREHIPLIDISATGMKFNSSHPIDTGILIYAKIPILPNANIYYIKGNVIRVDQKEDYFEISVKFEIVSTQPLEQ